MTDKKGFILNHQEDGLCFIEAPEKPSYYEQFVHSLNHDGLRGFSNIQINEMKEYQKALELAIANRMVIVNPDVLYKNAPLLDNLEEGEMYRWAGTYKIEERLTEGWQPTYNNPDNIGCEKPAEPESVVRLIAPSEQKAVSLPSANEDQIELWQINGWILSRERMPDVDGEYLIYGWMHTECGNVYPFQKVVTCRFNQWVKSDVGEQITYWRPLLLAPVQKDNFNELLTRK